MTIRAVQFEEGRGMPEIDLSRAKWHKSSFSSQDGNCVEVARNVPGLVAVRDSKDPGGTTLIFPSAAWQTFLLAPVGVRSAGRDRRRVRHLRGEALT